MDAGTIGLDVGGTKIAGALVDASGAVTRRMTVPSPATDPEAIVAALAALVEELRPSAEPIGVGAACAGYLDAERSMMRFAPNLAWRDFPLRSLLHDATGLPVVIENDADAAAYGELVHGAGRDAEDLVMVTLGTGVGGSVVHQRRIHRGAFGIGGELGHVRIERNGRRCGCGNLGCLEAYSSGTALLVQAREVVRTGGPAAAALIERCGGDPDQLRGTDVSALAEDGDAASVELLAEVGMWLGEGMATVAAVLDPGFIVIGGGLSGAGDLVLGPARTAYKTHLTGRGYRPVARMVAAQLGNDAGMIGAAALAREGSA
ncbi:ROK family glucokinase [Luteipulveratus mongoliensis]|uniref:ROK family glucokinase n=1 Tax=Luteipulveratus mongoliensis TaxID=571913 RepID=UPI000A886EB6